ncbi:MAG: hypothetical protein AB7N61_19635 [Acidimicrobiia bacterium]
MRIDKGDWVGELCEVPRQMRRENQSLLACIRDAGPPLADDDQETASIERYLRRHPTLIVDWQDESDGTRGSPNHYFKGCEVGFYDAGFHDQTQHPDEVAACADFVYRKAAWVLARRRVLRALP